MPSVAKQWAVTTDGTFDFNDPANWVFGSVPGVLDFDKDAAEIAALA